MKDLKYLTAYLVPLSAIIGIYYGNIFLFVTPLIIFIIVPILELFMPQLTTNLDEQTADSKIKNIFFDVLLWLNLPIVFGTIAYGLYVFTNRDFENYETIGLIFSLGIVSSSNGINVAHELGHRQDSWERFVGKALLLPNMYMHFYVEHNYGHHPNAATPEDPATARYNENLYTFWFRSVTSQYKNAWKIQSKLNNVHKTSFLGIKNDMLWYTVIQLLYVIVIALIFSWSAAAIALGVGLVGFTLLEIINYLEHYGLRREQKKSGRYEVVREIHSWNSNHALGRILLYELTRHSDHHYRANKKYQVLDYHEESPQLPYGYPTMMVIALCPPLWFKIVNKHVPETMKQLAMA